MTALELDRQIAHRGGTWSLGVGYGYYRVSAASLAADGVTRTGDTTALRLIPFTLMAVYHWTIYRPDLLPLTGVFGILQINVLDLSIRGARAAMVCVLPPVRHPDRRPAAGTSTGRIPRRGTGPS